MRKGRETVPKRFREANVLSWLDTTSTSQQAKQIATLLEVYIEDARDHKETGKGLLLYGPPGTGKTYLACAVLNALAQEKWRHWYITMVDYLRDVQTSWDLGPKSAIDEGALEDWWVLYNLRHDLLTKTSFLVLDDIGKEYRGSGSGWAETEIDYLLRKRFDLALPTILTSNTPLSDWASYGEAMASFLHEAYVLIDMTGLPDLRRA